MLHHVVGFAPRQANGRQVKDHIYRGGGACSAVLHKASGWIKRHQQCVFG
jgi:hypothetical protein